ncbi:toxin TcdB middle/N-terminal domain-containing protein [Desulfobacterales bacterium HSG17]|nr:toxin TcdB middle/N-terminal domain-containing protein [Desulfobacterales bacterium HSG17]
MLFNLSKMFFVFFCFTIFSFIPFAFSSEFTNDIDTTYKFTATKAPDSPYKNTWSAFQTDLFSGSFGYQYNIEVPPGTNDLTPEITFSHNSHSSRGKAGWVGAGFDIPLSFVQRDIEYTRKDTTDDTYDLHLKGAKHDLVFVPSEFRFHTKIESYLKIEKLTGAPNETGEYWLATAKDGTQFRFGYNLDSEHMVNSSDKSFTHYVWRWSLDQITDTNGNQVYFSYTEYPPSANITSASGDVYLSKIEYNNDRLRVIDFILEDRPDVYLQIDQGSEIIETKRLKEIKISVSGKTARTYKLTYVLNEAQNKSLLTAITHNGADGNPLPPVRFDYKPMDKSFTKLYPEWQTPDGKQWVREVDHKSNTVMDTFDINGDHWPDLIKATDDEDWEVYYGSAGGFTKTDVEWDPPADFRQIRDIRRSQEIDKGANTRSAPMDFNRDGLVDIVRANSSSVLDGKWNIGTEFEGKFEIPLPIDDVWIRRVQAPDDAKDPKAPNVKQTFLDINGDGYPDLVKRAKDHFGNGKHAWHIWRNTGTGFVEFGYWAVENQWLEEFESDEQDVELTTADLNADGLVDIIWGKDKNNWRVYFNTGSRFVDSSHWFKTPADNAGNWAPPGLGDDDIVEIDKSEKKDKAANTSRIFADFNGDGLPDLVEATDHHCVERGSAPFECLNSAGCGTWEVYLNKGFGFTPAIDWIMPVCDEYVRDYTYDDDDDPEDRHTYVRRDMMDMNGDGCLDVVHVKKGFWQVWFNNTAQTDLLLKVTDTLGGTISVTYNSSMQYKNSMFPQRRLNSNYWLVSSIITDNGMNAHQKPATTSFIYEDGWYNYKDREFRGFAKVEELKSDGTKVKHFFHQDETNKGKEFFSVVRRSDNAWFSANKNRWHDATGEVWGNPDSDIRVSRLLWSDAYTYDGKKIKEPFSPDEVEQDTIPKKTRVEYRNFDKYGNIGLEIQHGEYPLFGDELFTFREFEYNQAKWIMDRVNHTFVRDSENGKNLRETWIEYYENGNPFKEIANLEGSRVLIKTYKFDNFGNVKEVRDANDNPATNEYDSIYHTFPIKTCNALNQCSTRIFNPVNGQVLKEIDPNGFTISFEYDEFGRKIKEIKPYDSSEFPTTGIQYFIDGIPPEMVKTSKRENHNKAETLDTWQFIDGFANLVQTKTEYEDPSFQVVTDVFYDKMNRVQSQSSPYLADFSENYTTPAGPYAAKYQYDTLGRPVGISNPDNTQITRTFDLWTVTEWDEKAHPTSYKFDAFQRLLQVTEDNQGEKYFTNYTYSPVGEITGIQDHLGNKTGIIYDTLGRKTAMSDPDMGTWFYEYDNVNNLVNQTDARKISTSIVYDALNRKIKVDYPDPKETGIEFLYDKETKGTLAQVNDASGIVKYFYDKRLRKTREEQSIDSYTWTTLWNYDAMDRVISQVYPAREGSSKKGKKGKKRKTASGTIETVPFTYNNQGLLESIPGIIPNINYNYSGQITQKEYQNGVNTQYTYAPDNQRLTNMNAPGIQDFKYSYDEVGNILTLENNITSLTQNFDYDDLDRLISAADAEYSSTYTYNAIGNMMSETINAWKKTSKPKKKKEKFEKIHQQTDYTYGKNAGPHAVTGQVTTQVPE